MSLATANPDGLPDIVPFPSSLRAAALMAQTRKEPMIVMVTLKGCAFCDIVRNNYLGPMFKKGEVFAIQLNMLDRKTALQDLHGNTTSPYDQARAWKARIAPTLLFLDADGTELAERLEGMTAADFYGAYLDERIRIARNKVRAR